MLAITNAEPMHTSIAGKVQWVGIRIIEMPLLIVVPKPTLSSLSSKIRTNCGPTHAEPSAVEAHRPRFVPYPQLGSPIAALHVEQDFPSAQLSKAAATTAGFSSPAAWPPAAIFAPFKPLATNAKRRYARGCMKPTSQVAPMSRCQARCDRSPAFQALVRKPPPKANRSCNGRP